MGYFYQVRRRDTHKKPRVRFNNHGTVEIYYTDYSDENLNQLLSNWFHANYKCISYANGDRADIGHVFRQIGIPLEEN